MSKYTWVIDNGHGGVINGNPQTKGKRSPDWPEHGILYGGVSNRRIAKKLLTRLKKSCIDCVELVPEITDVWLSQRVARTNVINKAFLISLHSDAFTSEKAHGWSTYTSIGQTTSDSFAEVLYQTAVDFWGDGSHIRKDTTDGDLDKEANFYILRRTKCPAVLVENFFMTNHKDYLYLNSEDGQNEIVNVIYNAIVEFENG
jgi:N-acetylmuramoyl-L-alanine amidase